MMKGLSEHTLLVNAAICLTRKSEEFPSPLFDMGYQLECIGLKFSNRDGETINPDLSIKGDLHGTLLLVDCKSGGVKHLQAARYARLTAEDIVSANVTSMDSANLVLDIAFFGTGKNREKLIEADNRGQYGIPIVILDKLLLKKDVHQFKTQELEALFDKGVTFRKRIPTSFYPFSADDPPSYILNEIAPFLCIMHLQNEEFSEDDILQKAHPFLDYSDDDEKASLKGRIGNLLSSMQKDQDYRFLLDKQKKWKIDPEISSKNLKSAIQKFIEKLEKSERDTRLSDFEAFQKTPILT